MATRPVTRMRTSAAGARTNLGYTSPQLFSQFCVPSAVTPADHHSVQIGGSTCVLAELLHYSA
jgi:hypothetical protein